MKHENLDRLTWVPLNKDEESLEGGLHTSRCRYVLLFALCLAVVMWCSHLSNLGGYDRRTHGAVAVTVFVNTGAVKHTTDERYASVAIDSSLIQEKFRDFDTSSVKLLTLASALNPSYIRVGGTAEDLLIFGNETNQNVNAIRSDFSRPTTNFTMTTSDWDKLNRFVVAVGWKLVFGLNILLRDGSQWDKSNALALLEYTQRRGYTVQLELGNEPNSFHHVFGRTLDPYQAGRDFGVLRKLMKSLPGFASSLLIGPDVTSLIKRKPDELTVTSLKYLKRFLMTGSQNVDVVSFHHYYVRAQTTTLEEFTNASILDSLADVIQVAEKVVNATAAEQKPVWEGEVGSASGGGAPGLSDRYIAGFMWLDRLGLSAVSGVDVVIRQSFYSGHYAMIDRKDYTPYPDYWLTLLYKRLVGTKVFAVNLNTTSREVRIYAHCTRVGNGSSYRPGALTVYALNLRKQTIQLKFSQFQESDLDLYLLTPGGSGSLTSRTVRLNGRELLMTSESELPLLQPVSQHGDSPVTMDAQSFGFVVIPNANVSLCA